VIASAVVPLFGGVGANLMLLCFVATGITLFTGWSWLTIVERIGAACTGSVSAIYHFPTTLGRWLTGGWRQPRYEGGSPAEGGVGSFDQEEDDEDPHSSWTRNPKAKNRAQRQKLTNGCRSLTKTPSSSIRSLTTKRTRLRRLPPRASAWPMASASRRAPGRR
jgi:DNA segregation ATPase FtsK/SpoIIIE-like protein